MERSKLYASLRTSLFKGGVSQTQVNGVEGILDAFATHGDGKPDKPSGDNPTTIKRPEIKQPAKTEGPPAEKNTPPKRKGKKGDG